MKKLLIGLLTLGCISSFSSTTIEITKLNGEVENIRMKNTNLTKTRDNWSLDLQKVFKETFIKWHLNYEEEIDSTISRKAIATAESTLIDAIKEIAQCANEFEPIDKDHNVIGFNYNKLQVKLFCSGYTASKLVDIAKKLTLIEKSPATHGALHISSLLYFDTPDLLSSDHAYSAVLSEEKLRKIGVDKYAYFFNKPISLLSAIGIGDLECIKYKNSANTYCTAWLSK